VKPQPKLKYKGPIVAMDTALDTIGARIRVARDPNRSRGNRRPPSPEPWKIFAIDGR
jgi:hypothetical protein